MRQISAQQRMELTQAFKNFDLDGNGFIDRHEIREILRQQNIDCSDAQLDHIMASIDDNSNGYWDLDEFINFMVKFGSVDRDSELRAVFDELDLNKNGTIDLEEFTRLIRMIDNRKIDENDIKDYMALLDVDGDGLITYEEFCAFFRDSL